MPKLSDVISLLEELYPPRWAESWDAVGLVCGDPADEVRRVLFAVDPVQTVVEEAVEWGADLLVTHHPLYLRGTSSVAATGFKGRVVHTLIRSGIALHVAHTNADHAAPGVSDALAEAIGLKVTDPLVADPTDPDGRRGSGRIGELLEPLTLTAFAARVAAGLPATATGVRVSGDPQQPIRRVAVCGGAGDSFLEAARAAGVDAYVTADLRHHPASEAAATSPLALLDAAHWATEWPWLNLAARDLTAAADRHGWPLETRVSTRVTDPWTAHAPMPYDPAPLPSGPAPSTGPAAL
ncbi:Nif3-like dinuclear metal center hexameric protein [Kitasatospora nipponensis]|uniref:GTP cyclohydrolase 1 type 2 homolog n=1 Tax=Kitasatospora nipponensis TaxID=258049 RepID=A0ABP4HE93_9ACTN